MNKPYIWMDDLDTWFTDEDYQNLDDLLKEGMFPLYTYPVKELTDEEIWEVIDNCFGVHAFNLDYQIALDEAREDAFGALVILFCSSTFIATENALAEISLII